MEGVERRQRGQQGKPSAKEEIIDLQLAGVLRQQGRLSAEGDECVWNGDSVEEFSTRGNHQFAAGRCGAPTGEPGRGG